MIIESPRLQLNRGLVILRYKQPYIDWVRVAGEFPMDIILEVANSDGEAFLVPTFECPIDPVDGKEDAIKWVEKRWRMFFEHILGSWIIDESEWPKKRTLKIFREWFDIEYKSMIWDMGNEPFVLEEWEDEDLEDGELLH